jgi:hypothetical protein
VVPPLAVAVVSAVEFAVTAVFGHPRPFAVWPADIPFALVLAALIAYRTCLGAGADERTARGFAFGAGTITTLLMLIPFYLLISANSG